MAAPVTLNPLPTQAELRTRRPPVAPVEFREPALRDHREPGDPPWTAAELLDGLPDDDVCPDDPDGLHHSGCGCDDVDPLNP